ncbi:MAG: hypothetical protein AB7G28_17575 [Pirellulales bacterium]
MVLRTCSRFNLHLPLLLLTFGLSSKALGDELLITDYRTFPGELWQSNTAGSESRLIRREATANPAYPRAIMKLADVTVGPDGQVYYCSGLDGCVLALLDRRNEVLSFEYPGQIRDIDSGNEPHTVYFSVVPTPQNNEALADGKIYRRDIWAGAPVEVATIRQADVGNNWWGTFTIVDGTPYIATLENPSRLFKITSAGAEPVFLNNHTKIVGLTAAPDGTFLYTDGTNKVYRTSDFNTAETAYDSARPVSDVAIDRSNSAVQ